MRKFKLIKDYVPGSCKYPVLFKGDILEQVKEKLIFQSVTFKKIALYENTLNSYPDVFKEIK